ncbi:NADH-quinone oxidoreductase subunit L [Methylocaldum sp.]|uniref:NADH-quinone oxidoreductase subunit 5 family protein n=1 Tax=Methylocaldum sp. TaxID=1969727 RepID=UPI002D614D82|nr:proton-conducting transporter membrane subunit [Methylocaldum sp.]HYE35284.1 proton-conducting transporter membrane subunit [Methylocaldum sp.]
MLDWIIPLVPGLPILAASAIGIGLVSRRLEGEPGERPTAAIAVGMTAISFILTIAVFWCRQTDLISEQVILGTWLSSGDYLVNVSFALSNLSLALSSLFALFSLMVARFSVNYMHREAGFHRFFLILSLFAGAMQLLVLAGNAVFTFIGWELAGVCSYLLIAYAYDRPVAAANATHAFVTNRIGDAGFTLGIFLAFAWTGGVEWPQIIRGAANLDSPQAGLIAVCFLLAAAAKSAQVPLSPWLARAMEGPTPSSAIFYGAVMIHAGVFLVLRLQAVFEAAPTAMALMAAMGLVTALYGFICSLTQTDVKSALIFSTTGQVGLMFLACGLGWWQLAAWHLGAHTVLRGYQFLTAPALMHRIFDRPARPVPSFAGRSRWLYTASLQRFWLEHLGHQTLVKPIGRFAADLNVFDRRVVEEIVGLPAPAMRGLSALAEREEHRLGAGYGTTGNARRIGGLLGILTDLFASAFHWFEERLVLQGLGMDLVTQGRRLGMRLTGVESVLTQPRYLILLVIVTLLATV